MTLFWKSVALALGMSAVLCACTQEPPGNPPQGPEPVSQESSSAEPLPESQPSDPMPVAVDFGIQFLEALQRGDITQMEKMVWNGEEGSLAYWETVTLGNPFDYHYDEAQADDSYALLEVLLHVEEPGKTPLRPGDNQLVLTIGWFGGDPLALLPYSQTRYLLAPNGDGSYRFLSAIQEDFQP